MFQSLESAGIYNNFYKNIYNGISYDKNRYLEQRYVVDWKESFCMQQNGFMRQDQLSCFYLQKIMLFNTKWSELNKKSIEWNRIRPGPKYHIDESHRSNSSCTISFLPEINNVMISFWKKSYIGDFYWLPWPNTASLRRIDKILEVDRETSK